MTFEFRRVVTELGDDGRSTVHEDVRLPIVDVPAMSGTGFLELGGSDGQPRAGEAAPVVEGELHLQLDDAELRLTPGACVVQNGTRQAWENRGDVRAVVVSFLLGAERVR